MFVFGRGTLKVWMERAVSLKKKNLLILLKTKKNKKEGGCKFS